MEQMTLDTILKVSAAITGAIIGWMAVLRPLWDTHKAKKAEKQKAIEATLKADQAYRQSVLDKLDSLDGRIQFMDRSIADLQRDNIERAYCMFKMEHGYCTSGMKEAIADMYESYKARGYNHIAESRIKELLALPEYPHN
ncbi:MAG: hypothetical protein ACOX6Y_08315 [Christensenellales bacterium]|jgi:hypothetical protein